MNLGCHYLKRRGGGGVQSPRNLCIFISITKLHYPQVFQPAGSAFLYPKGIFSHGPQVIARFFVDYSQENAPEGLILSHAQSNACAEILLMRACSKLQLSKGKPKSPTSCHMYKVIENYNCHCQFIIITSNVWQTVQIVIG